jgi:hypothetical protein
MKGRRNSGWIICFVMAVAAGMNSTVTGQDVVQIEDFEFATSDFAAGAGVTDITDWQNQPTFYDNGEDFDEVSEGSFSLGTNALFGASGVFAPGTFIGFRREISPALFPGGVVLLQHTYGDPAVPGPVPPDYFLNDLTVLGDYYGENSFELGPTGVHMWVNLIDAEGERFQFVNYSEPALYSEFYTLDVISGEHLIQIDPESLTEVPDGNRLLTEIVAFEMLIQDVDSPPTSFGDWYIDNLRIIEPPVGAGGIPGDSDGDDDVDLVDFAAFQLCYTGSSAGPVDENCQTFDFDDDTDVDLTDFGAFQLVFTGQM